MRRRAEVYAIFSVRGAMKSTTSTWPTPEVRAGPEWAPIGCRVVLGVARAPAEASDVTTFRAVIDFFDISKISADEQTVIEAHCRRPARSPRLSGCGRYRYVSRRREAGVDARSLPSVCRCARRPCAARCRCRLRRTSHSSRVSASGGGRLASISSATPQRPRGPPGKGISSPTMSIAPDGCWPAFCGDENACWR